MELFSDKPEADDKGPYALRSGPVLMGEEELIRRANSMLGQAMEKNWGAEEALFVWTCAAGNVLARLAKDEATLKKLTQGFVDYLWTVCRTEFRKS